MQPEKFTELLDQVCTWRREKHQGQDPSHLSPLPDIEQPSYIKVVKLNDRPCPYRPGSHNCDIAIKWIGYMKFFLHNCRTCKSLIYDGKAYDANGTRNVVNLYNKIAKGNK